MVPSSSSAAEHYRSRFRAAARLGNVSPDQELRRRLPLPAHLRTPTQTPIPNNSLDPLHRNATPGPSTARRPVRRQLLPIQPLQPVLPPPAPITPNLPPNVSRLGIARMPFIDPPSRHYLGRMDVACPLCGALHWMSEKLSKSSRINPRFGTCCNSGKTSLPLLPDPPIEYRQLLSGTDVVSAEFRDDIWKYNRALAFTSLSVQEDHSVNRGRGEPVFRIHGDLCHRSGSLLPSGGRAATYAQLYIYDPVAALDQRMRANESLVRDTMASLQTLLNQHHRYAAVYRHAYEVLRQYPAQAEAQLRLRVAAGTDPRTHNLPTANEVAVILPNNTSPTDFRDIILHMRGGPLLRISECHAAYAPLQYPLLFPFGEAGWHSDLKDAFGEGNKPPRRLTLTRFVAYRIHDRRGEFSALLRGKRLFQRYVVDMAAANEQNKLFWHRTNQGKLRAELYSGLQDAMAGDADLNTVGQRTILPSTFPGSPRHMFQQFQDSMAIARYFRKVDIFMTVTANPDWQEIRDELRPGETAYDRPDLVSRVFHEKIKSIIGDIYSKSAGAFGAPAAFVYTIEFQKRGLPHMHLLIFLDGRWKIFTPNDVDSFIRAYWPDEHTEPNLFHTVKNCMVHGPCGAANANAPCMKNGYCTKGYPKNFHEATTFDENSYPNYRRPNNGVGHEVRGFYADNRWVVPYNPYFSAKYDCHINVECAVSLGTFKYAFKYINKGTDHVSVAVHAGTIDPNDEIGKYLIGRWLGASEATWHILHYEMHKMVPNVVRLPVHLPGRHLVVFDPEEAPEALQDRLAGEKTRLTEFFRANAAQSIAGDRARQCTYQEFPQHFVWTQHNTWKLRAARANGDASTFALGRMYFVPPTDGERFYLRTLLTVVKGPTSFADLRTYDGVLYDSFEAACQARGLLLDDNEWRLCLCDAVDMQTGHRLRVLFSTLLLFCELANPLELWQEFRDHLCDDLHRTLQRKFFITSPSREQIFDYGLYLLDGLLRESGSSISSFPSMPRPLMNWEERNQNPLIAEQLDYNVAEQQAFANINVPKLNVEQRNAFDSVVGSVREAQGRVFFLHGPAGTGKTFVYRTVCSQLRAQERIVLCVASSGIAALLIPGGRTAHSMFKIPIQDLNEESFCSIRKQSPRAELLRRTELIIWDEVGPQHRYGPEAVDRTMRDLLDCDRPFGGVTVVFGGDFQQTLPVVPRGSRDQILDASIQNSHLWNRIEVLLLHTNMRLLNDQNGDNIAFADWLLHVGRGTTSTTVEDTSELEIDPSMTTNDPENLINSIYDGLSSDPPPPPEYFLNRTILAARNTDVSETNEAMLKMMAGEPRTYFSADEVVYEPGADSTWEQDVPVEFLRSINDASLPPGELNLKVGCPLILLRNLAPARGLCNGTRMILRRMTDRVLEVELLGGDHHGEIAYIPRIALIPSNLSHIAFKFRRRQFPVRLAFAMTINKAQGQSVKYVGIDLRIPVFAHGQFSVPRYFKATLKNLASGKR